MPRPAPPPARSAPSTSAADPRYRRVLALALVLNLLMFGVELAASRSSGSVSLLADSIDFFGDAASYGLSLAVLGLGAAIRSRAAGVKALCMGGFGIFVLARALWMLAAGGVPEPATMGGVGLLALAVNVGVAWMLYRYRHGDADMRSVWICSRNDAYGNLAVMAAPPVCSAPAMPGPTCWWPARWADWR